ncbi:hypothetical protein ACO0QE_000037 [Hanseniaspora vineae]
MSQIGMNGTLSAGSSAPSENKEPSSKALQKSGLKYKIGKVRQTARVLVDPKTGLDYIQLSKRPNRKLYGVTKFEGCYSSDALLGKGTFGEVFKGVHIETQRAVAIKKLLVKTADDVFPITAQREIIILKKLQHKNIVKLIEVIYDEISAHNNNGSNSAGSASSKSVNYSQSTTTATAAAAHTTNGMNNIAADGSKMPTKAFFMVLPYMVSDLAGILHNPHVDLQMPDIKNMLLQILEGTDYLHKMKYMHRDIKSANILIDHKGVLKLADFGLARNYYGPPPNARFPGGAGVRAKYTSVVVTRWYRAPELVLGDKFYTTAVDLWGVGCLFAEFFMKSPILQGKTDIDQGHVIFQLMGTPTEESWPTFKYLPGKSAYEKTAYPSTLEKTYSKHLGADGLDLLSKLLCLDPYQRITSVAAKKHPFFFNEPLPSKSLNLPTEESHESDIARFKNLRKEMEAQKSKAKTTEMSIQKEKQDLRKPQELRTLKPSRFSSADNSQKLQHSLPSAPKNSYVSQPATSASLKPSRFQNKTLSFTSSHVTRDKDVAPALRPATHFNGMIRHSELPSKNTYTGNNYDQRKQRTNQASSSYVGSSYQSSSYVNQKAVMNIANKNVGAPKATVTKSLEPSKAKDAQIDCSSAPFKTRENLTNNQQRETVARAMPSKPRFSHGREISSGAELDYGDEPRLRKKAKITNSGSQNSKNSSTNE